MDSEGLLLDFDKAFFKVFSTPGSFTGTASQAISAAKLNDIVDIFWPDVSYEAADGRVGLVLVDGKLVVADESPELVFL